MQSKLTEYDESDFEIWEIIEEQIKRSQIKRINWKKLLGETLTKISAQYYAEGKTHKEAYLILSKDLRDKGFSYPKIFENLKIGISARYGEIKSESKRINEVLKNNDKNKA